MTDSEVRDYVESLRCKPRFPWTMIGNLLIIAAILLPVVWLVWQTIETIEISATFVVVYWASVAGMATVLAVVSAVGYYFTKDW